MEDMDVSINRHIEVCFSPAVYSRFHNNEAEVVVVDTLRATSAICTAFKHGAKQVNPVAPSDEALVRILSQIDCNVVFLYSRSKDNLNFVDTLFAGTLANLLVEKSGDEIKFDLHQAAKDSWDLGKIDVLANKEKALAAYQFSVSSSSSCCSAGFPAI